MNENTEAPRSSAVYDEKFYEYLVGRSLGSARHYLGHLWNSCSRNQCWTLDVFVVRDSRRAVNSEPLTLWALMETGTASL